MTRLPRRNRQNVLRGLALCLGTFVAVYTSLPDRPGLEQPQQYHLDGDAGRQVRLATVRILKRRTESPHGLDVHEEIMPPNVSAEAIINPHPYQYNMRPPHLCDGDPMVVVFVHSAPGMYSRRTNIRETWGRHQYHQDGKLKMFFVVGLPRNEHLQDSLRAEQRQYRDLLQENFQDSYRNLTLKVVGALGWIVKHCPHTPFVVKTDDDALVNVFSLIAHLGNLHRASKIKGLIMCTVNGKMPVLRRGKWNVTLEEYPEEFYPPYCAGVALIMTMDVARALYDTAFVTRSVWVDDVWLTGLVLGKTGIKPRTIPRVYTLDKKVATRVFLGDRWYQYLFAHLGPIAMKDIWTGLSHLAANYTFPRNVSIVIPGNIVL